MSRRNMTIRTSRISGCCGLMFLHSRNWFFPFSILYSKFKVVFLEGEFDEGKKVIDKYWVVYTKSAWRDFDYNQQKQNWIRWATKTKILYVYNDEYREQQNMEENYINIESCNSTPEKIEKLLNNLSSETEWGVVIQTCFNTVMVSIGKYLLQQRDFWRAQFPHCAISASRARWGLFNLDVREAEASFPADKVWQHTTRKQQYVECI